MAESITQRYLTELEPHRDALFAKALAEAGDPIRAEGLLQSTIHATFEAYATGGAPKDKSLIDWFTETLDARKSPSGNATAVVAEGTAMPAATWARLYGAVQLEAVRFGKGKALNPDSVLLSPDPLLAPRKPVRPDEGDALERHPAHFFALSAGAALLLGIALTIVISSRTSEVPTTAPGNEQSRESAAAPATEPIMETPHQPATQVTR